MRGFKLLLLNSLRGNIMLATIPLVLLGTTFLLSPAVEAQNQVSKLYTYGYHVAKSVLIRGPKTGWQRGSLPLAPAGIHQ